MIRIYHHILVLTLIAILPASAEPAGSINSKVETTLAKKISFDFRSPKLVDVGNYFSNLTGCTVVVDPSARSKEVRLKMNDTKVETALKLITRQTGTTFTAVGEALFISHKSRVDAASHKSPFLSIRNRKLRDQLGKKISFDFVDTPLPDVAAFLANRTGMNIVSLVPKTDATALTLKVNDMRLDSAMHWITVVSPTRIKIEGNVIGFTTGKKESR
jgi:type II secretory pathway component HofQ